jgi:hypothetical protein
MDAGLDAHEQLYFRPFDSTRIEFITCEGRPQYAWPTALAFLCAINFRTVGS